MPPYFSALANFSAGAYTEDMKRLLFTGGGSAGHVVPNLAVMQQLRGAYDIAYMGTDGIERALAAPFGCRYFTIDCPKLVRGTIAANLSLPRRLREAKRAALRILERERFDLVFSKGGYVSYPAVWAAYRLGIPALTHESDLTPGLCTRLIAGKCRFVLTSFPETARRFPNGRYVGSPIRAEVLAGDRKRARRAYGFTGNKPVLLVLGGGSGSRTLNDAVRAHLPALLARFHILHLCGKGNADAHESEGYVCREFEPDMADAYACCDLALSRAGSNTVFELLANKIPSLLVPLGRASRGDQKQNAAYFQAKGLCAVLQEESLAQLPEALLRLYGSASVRAALSTDRIQSGTERIADIIRRAAEQP